MGAGAGADGRDGLVLLKHDDIMYLEANDSYTTLHLKDGKRSVSSKHIRVFETNLDPKTFFRVHKSYIINLAHLKEFNRTEGNMAVLDNGTLIPVSRRRLRQLAGIEHRFYAEVDGLPRVFAHADEDMDRSNDDKTSAVHFLRFEFPAAAIRTLRDGAGLHLGIEDPRLPLREPINDESRAALLKDFD